MRQLHGLVDYRYNSLCDLKAQGLLFDKLYLVNRHSSPGGSFGHPSLVHQMKARQRLLRAEIDFLISTGFCVDVPEKDLQAAVANVNSPERQVYEKGWQSMAPYSGSLLTERIKLYHQFAPDIEVNEYLSILRQKSEFDIVPLCTGELPPHLRQASAPDKLADVVQVGMSCLPTPVADAASWEDIFAFKADERDKQWALRRFFRTLSTKELSESEIRDDFEWSLNEYRKAMKIHNLQAGTSFVEVYIIPAIEIVESLAKFNWSKIAKGALSVKKRHIQMQQAELSAPGREVAYIHDVVERFK